MSKYTIILITIFICIISIESKAETIYLKDGTKIIGKITNMDENEVIVESDIGIFKIARDKINKIEYEEAEKEIDNNAEKKSEILKELKINDLRNRKRTDLIGLTFVWGLTIVGDLAIGDDLFATSVIPVIGPFLTYAQLDESNYYDNDPDGLSRDRSLLVLSGLVQTAFFIDYLITSKKQKNLQRRYSYSVIPIEGGAYMTFNMQY